MGQILLFDIDGTLFDAEKFGKLTREEFLRILNIDEENLMRTIADYYSSLEASTDYNPREITVFMGEKYNIDPKLLDKLFWEEDKHYQESLFPETLSVLQQLSEKKTLGIFSQGLEDFQLHKLEASGIRDFFNKAFIFVRRRKSLEDATGDLPKGATVIDNNHQVVLKFSPVVNTKTIHSLEELITSAKG
ncbi:MAG: hypothetical protein UT20_C0039G0005 [Candidatus Levybacteria bacterium GW2011_GWA1_39_11]|nr:MAG: hypothetical protein UT20_C0039G0005 [Candidatus Levybacteria bacterium GW2011_GWA1_39_11]